MANCSESEAFTITARREDTSNRAPNYISAAVVIVGLMPYYSESEAFIITARREDTSNRAPNYSSAAVVIVGLMSYYCSESEISVPQYVAEYALQSLHYSTTAVEAVVLEVSYVRSSILRRLSSPCTAAGVLAVGDSFSCSGPTRSKVFQTIETAVAILEACTFSSRQVGLSEETAVPVSVLASDTVVQSNVRGPADRARSRSWACLPVPAKEVARIYGVSRDTRSYSISGYA